jgi:hypothetical protein
MSLVQTARSEAPKPFVDLEPPFAVDGEDDFIPIAIAKEAVIRQASFFDKHRA